MIDRVLDWAFGDSRGGLALAFAMGAVAAIATLLVAVAVQVLVWLFDLTGLL